MLETRSANPLPYHDFRSDTATAPTRAMFEAMMNSSLGDDVYNEDDSVKALEKHVAELCGHEAALYCASGTMTNQLAHRVHLNNPPQSAMVDIRSHVFNYEAGGISFHSQAAVYPVMPTNGQYLTAEDIASRLVLDVDVHYAPTRVISLENTLNGTLMPIQEMEKIRALTKEHGIKLHLDGARLWHACVATGIPMEEYCQNFDSISLCLSKGIGAPIGSILVGSHDLIKKARHFRLLFGGGWRQAGFLAEAALWCIEKNWPTMRNTHRQAKWLERVFLQVGCQITNPVDTNMVWVDTTEAGFTVEELMVELAKENIKISGSGCAARVVLHYQISDDAVATFIDVLRRMAKTPRMKVSVDITLASMREMPRSVYDDEDLVTFGQMLSLQQQQQQKQHALFSEEVSDVPPPRPISMPHNLLNSESSMVDPKPRQCLFEDGEGPTDDGSVPPPLPTQPRPRKTRSASKIRPKSAFEPASARMTGLSNPENKRASCFFEQDVNPTLRRTQSLDFGEQEAQSIPALDRSLTADKKKVTKLQYKLSHNPASKAFKRASIRLSRWGSLLTRES